MNDGEVKVICAANDDRFPVVGCRVGTVRASLVDAFNIPPQAIALVNGERVDFSYRLQSNDILEFCKQYGYKGGRRMFTKTELLQEYRGYPDDVMDDLFATLRHDDVNADGRPVWYEVNLDEWFDERYSRRRVDDGRDKVIPPSSVRLDGEEYTDLTTLEWRLLEVLLSSPHRSVETDKVIEHVYGHDAGPKEDALTQVVKRLNGKLGEQKCPYTVSEGNRFVTITR